MKAKTLRTDLNGVFYRKKSTDNRCLAEKIAVRKHFLRKFHPDNAKVFACCQGTGLIWKTIRRDFQVASYWGVDLKASAGRVAMDSVSVLRRKLTDNVIDVDTYGEPWEHWLTMLPNVTQPTSVFLTWSSMCSINMSTIVKQHVFGGELHMPKSLYGKLWDYANAYLLTAPEQHGLEIVECMESLNKTPSRYIGIHIRPKSKGSEEQNG
jgi:hypothetical protein